MSISRIETADVKPEGQRRYRRTITMVVAMLATVMFTGSLGSTASAQESTERRETSAFYSLARSDGLSNAQARGLQAKVDGQLRRSKGARQVAPNRIEFNNGQGGMAFPAPGEAKVRLIDGDYSTQSWYGCPLGALCFYTGTYYGGIMRYVTVCDFYNVAGTSWDDRIRSVVSNQTGHVKTTFWEWMEHWDAYFVLGEMIAPRAIPVLGGYKLIDAVTSC